MGGGRGGGLPRAAAVVRGGDSDRRVCVPARGAGAGGGLQRERRLGQRFGFVYTNTPRRSGRPGPGRRSLAPRRLRWDAITRRGGGGWKTPLRPSPCAVDRGVEVNLSKKDLAEAYNAAYGEELANYPTLFERHPDWLITMWLAANIRVDQASRQMRTLRSCWRQIRPILV